MILNNIQIFQREQINSQKANLEELYLNRMENLKAMLDIVTQQKLDELRERKRKELDEQKTKWLCEMEKVRAELADKEASLCKLNALILEHEAKITEGLVNENKTRLDATSFHLEVNDTMNSLKQVAVAEASMQTGRIETKSVECQVK